MESDRDFSGGIPEIYDSFLAPLIFEEFAADLAERVAALNPGTVLEIAAGTGVVARALAPRLHPAAIYTVTDLNQPMLDFAARRQGNDSRIKWRAANAMSLPFEDDSFDIVICQFSVMFFPDKVACYREARRVLRPGGSFIFSTWDRIDANEFADVVTKAVASEFPHDPPMFLARTPHGYHDVRAIESELQRAGFSRVATVTRERMSSAPSPAHPAIAYCQGTPLRNEIEARDAGLLAHTTNRATEAVAARFGAGPVSGLIRGHVFTAVK